MSRTVRDGQTLSFFYSGGSDVWGTAAQKKLQKKLCRKRQRMQHHATLRQALAEDCQDTGTPSWDDNVWMAPDRRGDDWSFDDWDEFNGPQVDIWGYEQNYGENYRDSFLYYDRYLALIAFFKNCMEDRRKARDGDYYADYPLGELKL
jgi:hypothetical protein